MGSLRLLCHINIWVVAMNRPKDNLIALYSKQPASCLFTPVSPLAYIEESSSSYYGRRLYEANLCAYLQVHYGLYSAVVNNSMNGWRWIIVLNKQFPRLWVDFPARESLNVLPLMMSDTSPCWGIWTLIDDDVLIISPDARVYAFQSSLIGVTSN